MSHEATGTLVAIEIILYLSTNYKIEKAFQNFYFPAKFAAAIESLYFIIIE